jgi:hypothetical protein
MKVLWRNPQVEEVIWKKKETEIKKKCPELFFKLGYEIQILKMKFSNWIGEKYENPVIV